MGERKVLNKYIPADFDPKLVPRGTKSKDDIVPVRMMLPFSLQCSTCFSFMYRGKKFNSKKEPMKGPEGKYLGIQRYRFYIKCNVCSRPITFLTDPKNTDYEMESGATRNYEVWQDKTKTEEENAQEKQLEETLNPMKALENRVIDSQREMEDLDNLDEIKAMNLRHIKLLSGQNNNSNTSTAPATGGFQAVEAVLKVRDSKILPEAHKIAVEEEEVNESGLTASEEALVRSIKFGHVEPQLRDSYPEDSYDNRGIVRLNEKDEQAIDLRRRQEAEKLEEQFLKKSVVSHGSILDQRNNIPVISKLKKRRRVEEKSENQRKVSNIDRKGEASLGNLLGAYASDSD
jgi:hypothetical protein